MSVQPVILFGFDAPNPTVAPTAIQNTTTQGLLSVGAYMYKYTFQTQYGETIGSPTSDIVVTYGNGAISLVVPISTETNVISRRIYRTSVDSSSPFRLIGIILDNITTVYVDTASDVSLGVIIPTSNTASSRAVAKGTINFSGNTSFYNAVVPTGTTLDTAAPITANNAANNLIAFQGGNSLPIISYIGQTITVVAAQPNTPFFSGYGTYVYPASITDQINALGAGNSLHLPPGASQLFTATGMNQWTAIIPSAIPTLILTPTTTFFGQNCGNLTTTGTGITGMGTNTLAAHASGNDITAVGYNNATLLTGVNRVTSVGNETLKMMTAGADVVVFGNGSVTNTTTANLSIIMGHSVAPNVSNLSSCVLIGNNCAQFATATDQCYAVGHNTLQYNTSGICNIVFGENAGQMNTAGSNNVFYGHFCGQSNMVGNNNVCGGHQAYNSATNGNNNTIFGAQAAQFGATMNNCAICGYQAGRNNTGDNNSFLGYQCGYNNTSGSLNTFAGYQCGYSNTTVSQLTACGAYALWSNTSGLRNTAYGYRSLYSNVNGSDNSMFGYRSGEANISGSNLSGIGWSVLAANQTGSRHSAAGYGALMSTINANDCTAVGYNAATLSTGSGMTAIGSNAMSLATTATNCTSYGYNAGSGITTATGTLCIGSGAGTASIGSNCVMIGAPGVNGDVNITRIGNTQTRAFIAGIRGITTGVNDAVDCYIGTDGQVGVTPSSLGYKKNVRDLCEYSLWDDDFIDKLTPVSFTYKNTEQVSQNRHHFGFIAEACEKVFPNLAVRRNDTIDGIHHKYLLPLLVHQLIQHDTKIKRLMTH